MSRAPRWGLVVAALLGVAMPAASAAQEAAEDVEVIDQVEVVEVVQAVHTVPGEALGGCPIVSVYGRLHPAFVHLPIGLLAFVVLLEAVRLVRRREDSSACGTIAIAAAAASTLPALASGFVRTTEMWANGPTPDALGEHRLLMLVASALMIAALVVRLATKARAGGAARWAYLLIVLAAFAVAAIGGHKGGALVFGEHHLPF